MSDDRDPILEEERVRALISRSDGPMVIRPLPPVAGGRSRRYGPMLSAVAFTVVMVVSAAIGAGVITSLRQVPPSPAATTSGAAQATPPQASSSPSSAAAGFASADTAAAAARQALEGRDYGLLLRLVAPTGWYVRWYEQAQTDPMSLTEAVNWISDSSNATWRVDASTVYDAGTSRPVGDNYVTALALDFHGWAEQRADILLRQIGGRWFWSSLLLYRPPPLGASADTIVGYATLITLSDATVTIRFRTVGSLCCSDQSWNDRVVVLRRDDSTIYNKAGGVGASSLVDSGATVGSNVWVQFRLDTLGPDGSFRLAWIVAMYP